jgi:hypothetical protein
MRRYHPQGVAEDGYNIYAYALGKTIEEVLRRAGGDLTRENILRVASNFKDFHNPMYREGITINTTPSDYATVRQAYLVRFDGKNWVQFGSLLTAR